MPGTSTWISETEAERARLEAARKAAPAHPAKPLTRDQIAKDLLGLRPAHCDETGFGGGR